MKYSGFIDGLLAEAAFARKTGDVSWLEKMKDTEKDPIKRLLLNEVCRDGFIDGVRRNAQWLQMQKTRLESLALEEIKEQEADTIIQQVSDYVDKKNAERQAPDHDDAKTSFPSDDPRFSSFFNDQEDDDGTYGMQVPMEPVQEQEEHRMEVKGGQQTRKKSEEQKGSSRESMASGKESDKDPESEWEKMRSEAMEKYRDKLEEKQQEKLMREMAESEITDTPRFGKGNAKETMRKMENDTLGKIPASLRKLARMIGRTGGFDTEKGRTFSRASKSDITGITIGDDLNSLLPSEIAVLSDVKTQDIFYKNYAEKRLQMFASASFGEQKKERQDGPVIICLDTSSSMNGEPARIARMLTIAVSIYAMRRRRKVMIIKYSDSHSMETFTKRRTDRSRLTKFLQWTGAGGNSENSMFKDLFGNILPKEPRFDAADILCISDFGWETLSKETREFIRKAKEDGMKFYALAVGAGNWMGFSYEDAISHCDSRWQWIKGQCVNIDE